MEERELPEMTEEFIKRFGIGDGSLEGLKAEIRKNMERELKTQYATVSKPRLSTVC